MDKIKYIISILCTILINCFILMILKVQFPIISSIILLILIDCFICVIIMKILEKMIKNK